MFQVFLTILHQSLASTTWLLENYYVELPYFHHLELRFPHNLTGDYTRGHASKLGFNILNEEIYCFQMQTAEQL